MLCASAESLGRKINNQKEIFIRERRQAAGDRSAIKQGQEQGENAWQSKGSIEMSARGGIHLIIQLMFHRVLINSLSTCLRVTG
jgi:hypothetical protein